MTNLISNALKYGSPDAEVVLRTQGAQDWVQLEVHNQGTPIAPDLVPVLFEPMQRGTLPHSDKSVGLGLYIVKDIVSAHGGSIEVTSTADAGTLFSVRLPRTA